ncbi:MAG: hypothetical protein SGI74_10820 [Oligoflexia bacterium]|nr:hypothetical protein [Oligoflexia bacterium]
MTTLKNNLILILLVGTGVINSGCGNSNTLKKLTSASLSDEDLHTPTPSDSNNSQTPTPSQTAINTTPGGCYPKPPPISRIDLVVHIKMHNKVLLDVTPVVCGSDDPESIHYNYCTKIMQRPYGRCCAMGPDGDAMRIQCESELMGYDLEDERVGPKWYSLGSGEVVKHPDNSYLAHYYGNGTAKACTNKSPAICGTVEITDNDPSQQ